MNFSTLLYVVLHTASALAVNMEPYPRDQTRRCSGLFTTVVEGGQPGTFPMASSPTGVSVLVSGNEAQVWDLSKGDWLYSLGYWPRDVKSAAVSPDGERLAIGRAKNHQVDLVRVRDGQVMQSLTQKSTHAKAEILKLVFSPDGQQFAALSYGDGGWLYGRSGGTWKLQRTLEMPGNPSGAVFSRDGGMLLLNSRSGQHDVFDLTQPGKPSRTILASQSTPDAPVSRGVIFSSDAKYLIFGSTMSTKLQVRDIAERKWINSKLSGELVTQRYIDQLTDNPDGVPSTTYFLATLAIPGTSKIAISQYDLPNKTDITFERRAPRLGAYLWDYVTGEKLELRYSEMDRDSGIYVHVSAFALSHNGQYLLMGDSMGSVRFYRVGEKAELFSVRAFPFQDGFLSGPQAGYPKNITEILVGDGDEILLLTVSGDIRRFNLGEMLHAGGVD